MLASFLWSYLLGHSGFSLLVKAENPPPPTFQSSHQIKRSPNPETHKTMPPAESFF